MPDVQEIINALEKAKLNYESESKKYGYVSELSKILEGTAKGLDLAINLVKIQAGISVTEQYVEDDVHLNFEEEAV